MAKSLRSKIKRRYRKAKRQFIDSTLITDRTVELNASVVKLQQGLCVEKVTPKNAFLYPNDAEAIFPKKELRPAVDFRCDALPLAGYAASGARRNFTDEEKANLGLILRSMDGCLDAEKRQLQDDQEKLVRDSINGLDSFENEVNTTIQEDQLIATINQIDIKDSMSDINSSFTSSKTATLDDLNRHQKKVGGRAKKLLQIPSVKNHLVRLKTMKKKSV